MNRPLEPQRYRGPFLYKYRSIEHLEWLKDILLENKLYFPTARELNDPEEAHPPLTAASLQALIVMLTHETAAANPFLTNRGLARDAAIIDFHARRFGTDLLLRTMKDSLYPHLERWRIYSLSKRRDNLHLWKKYAGGHTGYCLEFRNEEPLGLAFKVRYNDIALDITDPAQLRPYFLFYKTKSWLVEEEVRIVASRNSDATVVFDPRLLTRLIFGRDITPANAGTIRAWAGDREPPLTIVSEIDMPPDHRIAQRRPSTP
jgi:hypothetical protein